ncbi:MAG: hypothetical protein M3Q34_03350 [bacterium]|nr:hypothetical protein [bacterium]
MDLKSLTTKFFSKKKKLKKGSWIVNPDIYWKSILLLSVFLILGFFAFGFYLLNRVNSEVNDEESVNVVRLRTVNKERLDNVIEYFAKREKASMNIINLPSPVVDPSL